MLRQALIFVSYQENIFLQDGYQTLKDRQALMRHQLCFGANLKYDG